MQETIAPLPLDLTKVLESLEPRNSQSAEWLQYFTVASESNLGNWDDHVGLEKNGRNTTSERGLRLEGVC